MSSPRFSTCEHLCFFFFLSTGIPIPLSLTRIDPSSNTWHIAHLQGSFPLSPSKLISPPHYFCTSVKAAFTLSLTLQVLVLNFANFTYCSRRLSIDASACSAWMIMQSTALLLPFPSFPMPHLHVLIATCSTMLNESGKNGRKSLFLILWSVVQRVDKLNLKIFSSVVFNSVGCRENIFVFLQGWGFLSKFCWKLGLLS